MLKCSKRFPELIIHVRKRVFGSIVFRLFGLLSFGIP